MSVTKGKQATKGSKQIVEENIATLKFYRNMACSSTALNILINFIFFEPFSGLQVIMILLTTAIHGGSYYFMAMMSKPQYSDTGSLMDSGSDLNLDGGVAEHVKDIIILTTGSQLMSLISNYFWLLLLLAPLRALWLLWNSVIKPWLLQKGEEEAPINEKKRPERKIRRVR
ncbi:AAEL008064-PA [Aedes aegypti]|uniref:Transmembrane protein 208 n=2 Tax=Aedes aegypti TaxID=7159 RepID=A0A1S4FIE0_AEDAE|nr:transmembrane protein 208 [Aedes aegypti]EAT40191.1 AAEL008064-PA [Aedes aegypti]